MNKSTLGGVSSCALNKDGDNTTTTDSTSAIDALLR
jgi:hypothetical protein